MHGSVRSSPKRATVSRLPSLRRDQLDPDQQAVWDRCIGNRPEALVDRAGGLVGPFNAWVTEPAVGGPIVDLGAAVRFGTSLERRLLELAIITVGAHWRAEFEFAVHGAMAMRHGIPTAVVEALAAGQEPPLVARDEQVVHAVARQLVRTGSLDADLYGQARALVGDRGLVDLVTVCGYYTLVCFTLNAFAVAPPDGVAPRWPGEPTPAHPTAP